MDMSQEELLELLNRLSVELRKNLGNIHTMSNQLATVEMREQDQRLDQRASALDQSFYRLLRLADNLSDVEYLSSTKPFRCQITDMVSLVGDICAASQSAAWESGKTIAFSCAVTYLPWGIHRRAMECALYHLISNALKYTPDQGTVTVEIEQQETTLHVCVSDAGPGMTEQEIQQALTICKASDIYDDAKGGFGIGLPIVLAIAQRHGGTLTITSTPDQGTTATMSLPIADKAYVGFSDVPAPYTMSSGFNPTLLHLADALPAKAFGVRGQS